MGADVTTIEGVFSIVQLDRVVEETGKVLAAEKSVCEEVLAQEAVHWCCIVVEF